MTVRGRELAERKRRRILPCIKHYYEDPMIVSRAHMQHVWDEEGRRYLDFFAGILTVNVGHCNEAVTRAAVEQMQTLQHTSTVFLTEPMLDVADALVELAPGDMGKVFFGNSGTEAIETALLMAKLATGREEVVALRQAYHGRSQVAIGTTGLSSWRLPVASPPGVVFTHAAYCYRCPLGLAYPSCDLRCARDLEDVIDTQTHGKVAALVAEPIQGVGGLITPPPEYFRVLKEILDRKGGLFIADEIQTGFARTGTHFFGIEHWGVEPDAITCAKAMANGLPVGAVVATDAMADAYSANNISTFGGNPVVMRAARATIEEIRGRDLPARAARLGERFRAGLDALADRHAAIGEVRGKGLMLGLELVRDRATKEPAGAMAGAVLEECRKRALLVGRGGGRGNVLRLTPPLIIDDSDVDDALAILDEAFTAAGSPAA